MNIVNFGAALALNAKQNKDSLLADFDIRTESFNGSNYVSAINASTVIEYLQNHIEMQNELLKKALEIDWENDEPEKIGTWIGNVDATINFNQKFNSITVYKTDFNEENILKVNFKK